MYMSFDHSFYLNHIIINWQVELIKPIINVSKSFQMHNFVYKRKHLPGLYRMLVRQIKINWLRIVINLFIYKLKNQTVVILNILKAVAFIHSAHTPHTSVDLVSQFNWQDDLNNQLTVFNYAYDWHSEISAHTHTHTQYQSVIILHFVTTKERPLGSWDTLQWKF